MSAQKEGWLCPRCGAVNAPWMPTCLSCKPAKSGRTITKPPRKGRDKPLQGRYAHCFAGGAPVAVDAPHRSPF